jgi:hypothetical protein
VASRGSHRRAVGVGPPASGNVRPATFFGHWSPSLCHWVRQKRRAPANEILSGRCRRRGLDALAPPHRSLFDRERALHALLGVAGDRADHPVLTPSQVPRPSALSTPDWKERKQMTTTSLGRRVQNDRFPKEVVRVLRGAAKRSRSSFGDSPFLTNHTTALNELADKIDSVGLEDHLVRSLFLTQTLAGGSSDTYSPDEEAAQFIASCALGPNAPTPTESLAELVSVSIEDLNNSLHGRIKQGAAALKRASQLEESVHADGPGPRRVTPRQRVARRGREDGRLRRRRGLPADALLPRRRVLEVMAGEHRAPANGARPRRGYLLRARRPGKDISIRLVGGLHQRIHRGNQQGRLVGPGSGEGRRGSADDGIPPRRRAPIPDGAERRARRGQIGAGAGVAPRDSTEPFT